MQVVSPVVVGTEVAIPAGTYLQGRVVSITQRNSQVELALQSTSLAFVNGYVAPLAGPVTVQSQQGWLRLAPSSRNNAALIPLIFAPGIGAGIGAAVGFSHTSGLTPGKNPGSPMAKDAGIGLGIGAGALLVGVLIYHSHHHGPNFYLSAGAPMDTAFANNVMLDRASVAEAVSQGAGVVQPIADRPQPPSPPDTTPSGICFGPDTPGTPPTVIPGTPAIGDSPGTPDIVIPGTPSTPGGVVPCS
jgi:hypothetical protein